MAMVDKKELLERHIKLEGPPSEARLRQYGQHVWAIIDYYHAVDDDARRAARDYDISDEAVEAALADYADHKASIDVRLEQNAG